MANKIQVKRGLKASLPTLNLGEPALCTDTEEFYVGKGTKNIKLINEIDFQEIINARKGESDLSVKIGKIDTQLSNLNYIEVNLNDFGNIAKKGTVDEDWSLAFNHVFNNVIKNNSGVVKWSGQLKVKSTINVPYGVGLRGASLPYSGLVPTLDFVGDYVIKQTSIQSHIDFRNIYIAFENNPNVRGIYIANPYDYSTIDSIVGSSPNKTFLYVGNEQVGQTLRVENICVYAKDKTLEPLMVIENLQEGYFCNNKFLVSGSSNANLVECDGVNTSTWINNSFCNTSKIGLLYKYDKYPKRPLGNLFTGNLFENIKGQYSFHFKGHSNYDFEGTNNSIMNNDYMNSTLEVCIEYVANSIVIDRCSVVNGQGARRTFNINPYDLSNATEPYGHCMLKPDGAFLKGNFKGSFNGNVNGTGIVLAESGHIENNISGGGIRLISANGVKYTLQIDDNGNFIKTKIS